MRFFYAACLQAFTSTTLFDVKEEDCLSVRLQLMAIIITKK